MMPSKAKSTLVESRALASIKASCCCSAKAAASYFLTSLNFFKSVLFPTSIIIMPGSACSLSSDSHFSVFSKVLLLVMSYTNNAPSAPL